MCIIRLPQLILSMAFNQTCFDMTILYISTQSPLPGIPGIRNIKSFYAPVISHDVSWNYAITVVSLKSQNFHSQAVHKTLCNQRKQGIRRKHLQRKCNNKKILFWFQHLSSANFSLLIYSGLTIFFKHEAIQYQHMIISWCVTFTTYA